jgi:hypothetical protein
MRRSTLRQSPVMVVAILALVAAVAGTAVAGPGASTSAITKAKVKKVANKQINKRIPWKTGDIADNAVTAAKLAAGAVTAPKLGTLTVRQSESSTVPADAAPGNGLSQARNAEATCNSNEVALSGGVSEVEPEVDGAQQGLTVYSTRYVTGAGGRPVGIRARVGNDFPNDLTFRVQVLCLAG